MNTNKQRNKRKAAKEEKKDKRTTRRENKMAIVDFSLSIITLGVPVVAQWVKNPTSIHGDYWV